MFSPAHTDPFAIFHVKMDFFVEIESESEVYETFLFCNRFSALESAGNASWARGTRWVEMKSNKSFAVFIKFQPRWTLSFLLFILCNNASHLTSFFFIKITSLLLSFIRIWWNFVTFLLTTIYFVLLSRFTSALISFTRWACFGWNFVQNMRSSRPFKGKFKFRLSVNTATLAKRRGAVAFTSWVAHQHRQLTFSEGNSSCLHYCRLISRPSKANL